ncbi:MAG: tetratricopeptide repeat protein [Tissierellia bacterium]|nr:tetratricopeptide repeat protein [Tissierellia bacterium]
MNYKELIGNARDLLFLGNYEEAILAYDKAYILASSVEEVLESGYDKAELLAKLDRDQEAFTLYKELIRIAPNESGAYYGLAYTAERIARPLEEIASYYDKAISKDSDYHRAYYYGGHIYDQMGDKDKALKYFKKTVELAPGDHVAWNDLGATYEELGHYEDAIFCIRNSLEVCPTYGRAWYNLGVVLHRLGDKSKALEAYEQAIKINDRAITYLNMSAIYNEDEKFDLAESIIRRGLQNHPKADTLWYNLSCALLRQERVEDGIEAMLKCISLNTEAKHWMENDPDVENVYAEIIRRLDQEDIDGHNKDS